MKRLRMEDKGSNSPIPYSTRDVDIRMQSRGFHQRCVESHVGPLESSRFESAILGSGHTFSTANDFRDAIYLMSVGGRFRYKFKRNCLKHMTVICVVKGCPWKITARAIGRTKIVQIIRGVSEVFGSENHAHCYRHIKENFGSFLTKLNTKGRKMKENALQMLDSITYASLMKVSNGKTFLEVDLMERTCTLQFAREDILWKHAYFDGTVHDALGHTYPFLNPLTTKRPLGRPRKRRIESQFM
ncbi:hypothetical protein AAG906_038848 [Vitis piasezkii]